MSICNHIHFVPVRWPAAFSNSTNSPAFRLAPPPAASDLLITAIESGLLFRSVIEGHITVFMLACKDKASEEADFELRACPSVAITHPTLPRPQSCIILSKTAVPPAHSLAPKSIPGLNPTAGFVTHTPFETNPAALNRWKSNPAESTNFGSAMALFAQFV